MKKLKSCIVLLIAVLTMGTLAAETHKTINVEPGPKIIYDFQALDLKDANGNPVETFIYNGTTYVPIRAIASNFNKSVYYDEPTNTAYIDSIYTTEGEQFVLWYLAEMCYDLSYDIEQEAYRINSYNYYLLEDYENAMPFYSGYVNMVSDTLGNLNDILDGIISMDEGMEVYSFYSQESADLKSAISLLQTELERAERIFGYYCESGYGYDYALAAKTKISSELDGIREDVGKIFDLIAITQKRYTGSLSKGILG